MNRSVLMLVRGLPGSGKTTYAKDKIECWDNGVVVSADDYFTAPSGAYLFDPTKIVLAHSYCQAQVRYHLVLRRNVCVANTFSQEWEIEPYREIAKRYGRQLRIVDLFDGGLSDEALAARNVHAVPVSVISAMRERWQHNIEQMRFRIDNIERAVNAFVQVAKRKRIVHYSAGSCGGQRLLANTAVCMHAIEDGHSVLRQIMTHGRRSYFCKFRQGPALRLANLRRASTQGKVGHFSGWLNVYGLCGVECGLCGKLGSR